MKISDAGSIAQSPNLMVKTPSHRVGAAFEASFSQRTLLAETDRVGVISDGEGYESRLNFSDHIVEFSRELTSSEIERFKKRFKVESIQQEYLIENEELGLPRKKTNIYHVKFNQAAVDPSVLKEQCERVGIRGKINFSSEKIARIFQSLLEIEGSSKELGIKHVGFNFANTKETSVETEGGNHQTPYHTDFWFHRDYIGYYGNKINEVGWSAWDKSVGAGIKVSVIDKDFCAPSENMTTDIYGSSLTYIGYNFAAGSTNIKVAAGHGKSVSSMIFSSVDDSSSVAGIAPYASPILCHVDLSSETQINSAIINSRYWGAKVINMSFARTKGWLENPTWYAYYSGIVDANSNNVILVAATGNDGKQENYPAAYTEVMGVSGHNRYGNSAWISTGTYTGNYANPDFADIWAGGENVAEVYRSDLTSPYALIPNSGTSLASPIVAGTCALMLSMNPPKITNTASAITRLRSDAWTKTDNVYSGVTMKILDVYYGLSH